MCTISNTHITCLEIYFIYFKYCIFLLILLNIYKYVFALKKQKTKPYHENLNKSMFFLSMLENVQLLNQQTLLIFVVVISVLSYFVLFFAVFHLAGSGSTSGNVNPDSRSQKKSWQTCIKLNQNYKNITFILRNHFFV